MKEGKSQRSTRPHHSDLRPLAMGHGDDAPHVSISPIDGHIVPTSVRSPNSAISLASPTMLAIRQYYQEHGPRTALQLEPSPKNHKVPSAQTIPRRHSVLSPGGLVSGIEKIAVSSPNVSRNSTYGTARRSIAEESRNILLSGVNRSELARLSGIVSRSKSLSRSDVPLPIPDKVHFDTTHDGLRKWGRAYLGNTVTADIFVKAMHLRRAKPMVVSLPDDSKQTEVNTSGQVDDPGDIIAWTKKKKDIVVRARVLPVTKERRPFLLQRRFNLDEMRASIPNAKDKSIIQSATLGEGNSDVSEAIGYQPSLERSKSTPTPQPFKMLAESLPSILSNRKTSSAIVLAPRSRRIMPIHVEYALHYLPVLAALMFSGHLRKGDVINLPLPQPDAWREVISYIYTGDGVLTSAMKENILYLGGRVD